MLGVKTGWRHLSSGTERLLPRCNKWREVLHRLTVTAKCGEINNRNRRKALCDYFEKVREFLEQLIVALCT
jgi:hypothetical protein